MTELKFHRRHLLLLSALEKITSLTLDRSQNFEELSDFLNPEMDNKFPLTLCNNKPMIQGHYIWGGGGDFIKRREELLTKIQFQ